MLRCILLVKRSFMFVLILFTVLDPSQNQLEQGVLIRGKYSHAVACRAFAVIQFYAVLFVFSLQAMPMIFAISLQDHHVIISLSIQPAATMTERTDVSCPAACSFNLNQKVCSSRFILAAGLNSLHSYKCF
jgi:hypothetical protein